MPRLGDDQAAVGVARVAHEVLAAPGVVEPDDRAADERRATEQEEVLGRVVEQHADVAGPVGRQARQHQLRDTARLLVVLAVRPGTVAELDRHALADVGVGAVATDECRGIRRDERRLPGRRCGPRRRSGNGHRR